MRPFLPDWAHPWVEAITIALQVVLIILFAMLLRSLLHRFVTRLAAEKKLPLDFTVGSKRLVTFLLTGAALLWILDRMGVSAGVIWAGFTGFVTVGAIAFFAAWSVLSNIFCSVLIYTTRPFGLHDHIELLEGGDKPGLAGEVLDINLVYTTLKEDPVDGQEPTHLRIPNSLFFQRTTRLRKSQMPVLGSLLD
ncbi:MULTISPECIES: mechanosensitive ion channel family protein [Hydrogenophaga]|jgi:small-conductance mechanosensitive channel|uniref:Small-conductance mechanosensitive channel n=1 Tax=Hydrogenophaga intermedia TaxID=65786 RepID=A0A1L1PUJ6_HYDIT|nr:MULTISPECIES: mechanosensitive ion channel family protein [Hydrogenophaga]TMU76288.1 mechanosensitive ion channel family protein [Hydrogenophaga intermedia]CDN89716.1 Small-conductance mechanosensitive channel-like protein [Hydrogenophaga intermedia]